MTITAPSFVAAGSPNATTGSSITPAYPTAAQGVQAGDLFIMHCVGQGRTTNIPTVTTPNGWTPLFAADGSTNQVKEWVLARTARATGVDSGTVSVTVATPGTNGVVAGVIYAFRGVAAANFVESADIRNGLSTSIVAPPVTAGDTRLCVCFVGVGGNVTPTAFSGEIGGNWVVANTSSGVTGDGYSIQLQTAAVSKATITGGTSTILSDNWVTRAFALRSFYALGATSLADRAPLLGQPAIGQKHAFAAIALADRAPLLGTPLAAMVAASDLTAARPTLGLEMWWSDGTLWSDGTGQAEPLFGQVHALATAGLAAAAPTLVQPVMVIRRNLAASSLAFTAPSLAQPVAAQEHVIAATSLADLAPVLDRPIFAILPAMTALPLISSAPSLDAPTLAQTQVCVATSLADAAPIPGQPIARQTHVLGASALVVGAPELMIPTVGQHHALAATALASAPATLATPDAGQAHALVASALASRLSTLGQPGVAQVHALAASGLTNAVTILDQAATATATYSLQANDLVGSASTLTQPAPGQRHALAAITLASSSPALEASSLVEVVTTGAFHAVDLVVRPATFGCPRLNWRVLTNVSMRVTNTQAKTSTYGAAPVYTSAGAGVSSTVQFGAIHPLAPGSVAADDVLVWLAVSIDSDFGGNVAAPTGYIMLAGAPFGTDQTPYAPRLHVAVKVAAGTESGAQQTTSYSLSSGDASRRSISARVFRTTAASGFAAAMLGPVTIAEGTGDVAPPGVGPANVNRLALLAVALNDDGDLSSAAGWNQATPGYKNTSGGDCTLDLQWATLAPGQSISGRLIAFSTSAMWVAAAFTLAAPITNIDVSNALVLFEDRDPITVRAVNQ